MLPFLVIKLFYHFLPFRVLQMMTPISSCLHTMHPLYPCIPISCFSRFCTLLCAIITVNTAYTVYFVLIHHCTNSLSSLHIFVHHCIFCASLHTKTSPGANHLGRPHRGGGCQAQVDACEKREGVTSM